MLRAFHDQAWLASRRWVTYSVEGNVTQRTNTRALDVAKLMRGGKTV